MSARRPSRTGRARLRGRRAFPIGPPAPSNFTALNASVCLGRAWTPGTSGETVEVDTVSCENGEYEGQACFTAKSVVSIYGLAIISSELLQI